MMSRFLSVCILGTFVLAAATGCKTTIGAHGIGFNENYENIHFFDEGPEFKLSREEAAEEERASQEAAP